MSSFQKQREQGSQDDPKKMLGVVQEPQEATLGQSVNRGQTAVSSHKAVLTIIRTLVFTLSERF